jgi:alkylated DNA repair protein (DNA oxidative demethylase)
MTRVTVAPGVVHWPGKLAPEEQAALVAELRAVARKAPFFQPRMPKSGTPFSVRMTNCGSLGWVSDERGYRYQPEHPETGEPWPIMPAPLLDLWRELAGYPHPPRPAWSISMLPAPRWACIRIVTSRISMLPSCRSRSAMPHSSALAARRGGKTTSLKLASGDVLLFGGEARLAYHGIDRILTGSSTLLPEGGRINLTLRRVTKPKA